MYEECGLNGRTPEITNHNTFKLTKPPRKFSNMAAYVYTEYIISGL